MIWGRPGRRYYRFSASSVSRFILVAGDPLEAQETLDRPIRAEWKTLSGLSRDDRAAKAYLGDIMREYDIPALALAIVGSGRAVFLSEGFCDPLGRRAVTDKTVFRASRLGMIVFNYLVLRLEGEGFLKLDLPWPSISRRPSARPGIRGARVRSPLEQTDGEADPRP